MYNTRPLRNLWSNLRSAIRDFKYEVSEGGVLFPRQQIFAEGIFEHDVNGLDMRRDKNIVVNEQLTNILDVVYHGTAAIATWYVALFINNVTPAATWTAANWIGTADEFTNYDEAARPAFVEAAAASQSITNSASKAAFTIATGGGSIWGAVLASASAKDATTGVLSNGSKFTAQRVLLAADVLNVGWTLTLTSS
mgnify:CR=1 FL=1